ncbi:MAG: diguanylate cyclase [Gemmatimonadetes bacterium]|nr:diguanylate cyclase [Gemmatimonadota bacterium]
MTPPYTRPVTPAFWRRLFAARNPVLTDAGAAGELLVARARLLFATLILVVPLVAVVRDPSLPEHWIGTAAATSSVALSTLVLVLVRRGWRPRWLGIVTCLYDVTLVSAVLASFLVVGVPHMAINSRVTFEVYFVALAATCLRYDRRVCMITGIVATVQYVVIVLAANRFFALDSALYAPFPYGTFSLGDQLGRIILLLVMTVLSATLVDRTERLRVLSTHDSLTGLYNRAYFDERLVEELLRARRYGRPISVAIVDIDRFKQVNDQYGHVSGDACLRAFANQLRESVRRTDIVARYGGEEFALILPETTPEDAQAKLDRVREEIHEHTIELPRNGAALKVSFSAGVAGMPTDGERADELVTRADARLLAAKSGGRNRVLGVRPTPVG